MPKFELELKTNMDTPLTPAATGSVLFTRVGCWPYGKAHQLKAAGPGPSIEIQFADAIGEFQSTQSHRPYWTTEDCHDLIANSSRARPAGFLCLSGSISAKR